jgi:hypothetical protein
MGNNRGSWSQNALNLTYAHLRFKKFSGDYTPGPLLKGEREGEGRRGEGRDGTARRVEDGMEMEGMGRKGGVLAGGQGQGRERDA